MEEFVGLTRIDTEADDEGDACERAVASNSEFGSAPLKRGDVAHRARLPQTGLTHPTPEQRTLPRWF
jgi:hypothetical protein